MQKEEFFQKAIDYLRETYPTSRFEPKDLASLQVDYYETTDTKTPKNLHLNMPLEYAEKRNFADWQFDVKEYFERILSVKTDFYTSSWDEVKAMVLPQIKRKEQMDFLIQKFPDAKHAPVHKDFLGDLVIAYVIDQPKGFMYITDDLLSAWKIDLAMLATSSLINLKNLPATTKGPSAISNGDGTYSYFFETNDGFDAARILLDAFHRFLQAQYKDGYLISIPHRDRILACPLTSEKKLAEITSDAYKSSSHPITPILIKYS